MESVGEFEYSTKDLIGHGAFAVVFKGRHKKNTSFTVAVKSITKKNLSKSQNLLGKEIKILKELTELHHENVVALLDCKETAHHVNLVMEYCNGGDLADYLHAKGTLSEDTIRLFLRQIAGAMRALNAKGIVHRDLKPQNILLCNSGNKANPAPNDIKLKIADFGFARFLQDGVMAATLCGSPMYMAPEVIMSLQYDAKADLWSIGTIVFQCLTGKAPFQAQTPQALKQFYEKNARLAPKIPSGTSHELTDLLYNMLKRNSKDRLEFDDFFGHPFLKKVSKSCSPVPIPTSREHHRSQPIPSQSPSSPVSIPSRCSFSSSPVSIGGPGSPTRSPTMATLTERSEDEYSSKQMFDKNNTSGLSKQGAVSPTEENDYVVVSSNPQSDNSYDSSKSSNSSRSNRKRTSDIFGATPVVTMAESPTSGSSRPTYLPVTTSSMQKNTNSATITRQKSLPIPVPSQKEAYLLLTNRNSIKTNSPSPTKESPSSPVSVPKTVQRSEPIIMRRRRSSSSGEGNRRSSITSTDISSLSPPSVQFSVGTPPSIGRRRLSSNSSPVMGVRQPSNVQRCSSGAIPPLSGSPHRKYSNVSPPVFNAQCISAATGLPTIVGSPTKFTTSYDVMRNENDILMAAACSNAENHPKQQIVIPFCTRAKTLPELCNCGANQNLVDRELLRKSGSAGRISDQILGIQHKGNNPHSAVMVPWTSGKPGHTCNATHQPGTTPRHSLGSTGGLFDSGNCCSNPSGGPNSLPFGISPPNRDGPIRFIAPELPEETLLAKEHNETLAKLNFVLTLVDCIIELAKSKAAPIPPLTESTCRNENAVGDGYKKAEQLVLYMRLLQMLSSSLAFAQDEIKANRLQPSSSVRTVLSDMNDRFRFCLNMCKSLNVSNVLQSSGIDPSSSMITADKLIYNYAIEMCQTAALDELFDNPQELSCSQQLAEKHCFKRYQTAQILLHSLSQQIRNDQDKILLTKYKEAVEKRLYLIQNPK